MSHDDNLLETLNSIEDLLKTLVRIQLNPVLDQELSDDTKKKLYLATGKDGIVAISQRLKCSTGWISGVWKRWEQLGLIEKDGRSYRKVL